MRNGNAMQHCHCLGLYLWDVCKLLYGVCLGMCGAQSCRHKYWFVQNGRAMHHCPRGFTGMGRISHRGLKGIMLLTLFLGRPLPPPPRFRNFPFTGYDKWNPMIPSAYCDGTAGKVSRMQALRYAGRCCKVYARDILDEESRPMGWSVYGTTNVGTCGSGPRRSVRALGSLVLPRPR